MGSASTPQLHNTLTGKLEAFTPVQEGRVRLYNCGPTVHKNHTQIGNLRSYTFSDFLKRYFIFLGFEVEHVIKITDVDDHIVEDCLTEECEFYTYIDENIQDFIRQLKCLNLIIPDHLPRVTRHIDLLVDEIRQLEEKGLAYRSNGSVYFDIAKVENYGALAGMEKQKKLKKNAQGRLRSFVHEDKHNENDFCLWKQYTQADGDVYWETDIGKGRPGWHLECATLARKTLGDTIDIHIGGISHIFPHHTNEIAISEALTGQNFVNYWLHHDYLIVDNRAMSRANGTWYVLQDILDRGYHPLILRYVLFKTHYRQALNFTWRAMDEAKEVIKRMVNFYHLLHQIESFDVVESEINYSQDIALAKERFGKALANDLNVSDAIAAIFALMHSVNINKNTLSPSAARECIDAMNAFDGVLGVIEPLYLEYKERMEVLEGECAWKSLVQKRMHAKQEGDYALADSIRDKLSEHGLKVKDIKGRGTYCELGIFL